MKKLTTISSIFALMAVPAVAAPTHTSATFPQSGVMEEDYQYTGQANVTNLKVASGTANTLAGYTDCPSGYPNSDAGATSTDECYKACTVADLPANSHAATASGKNYSGANVTDTCAIATCETGYTFNPGNPDLMTLIGISETAIGSGYKSLSGTGNNYNVSEYGITQNGEFVVDYGNKGKLHGTAFCSNQGNIHFFATTDYSLVDTASNLSGSTGEKCWCQLDRYIDNEGLEKSLSAPWVYIQFGEEPGECNYFCAQRCATSTRGTDTAPGVMVSKITPSAPSCDANVITINWDHADSADITANEAGSVTYGGNINTPKKAQHINGKIFTGWTFVTPNQ